MVSFNVKFRVPMVTIRKWSYHSSEADGLKREQMRDLKFSNACSYRRYPVFFLYSKIKYQ